MSARAERSGSPEAILLASRSHDASSGILPVAHILPAASAASAAAGKPLASAARARARRATRLSAGPAAPGASLSAGGASPLSGDSGHALGLAAGAGMGDAGSRTVAPPGT